MITGERGDGSLTRQGLEEYVSDCVILLDHRLIEQVATRRLRIVKYRGTSHGTNEYPFIIDERGFEVLPVTSMGLDHAVSDERISTGVPRLDTMLGGKGVYRGSSLLVSGTAGSGKTSLAASFARACGERGERCLYFAFEESQDQILRNMRSIGIDLRAADREGAAAVPDLAPDAVRARDASRGDAPRRPRVRAASRGGRPDLEPHRGRRRGRCHRHADAPARRPQVAPDHGVLHRADER